MVANYSFDVETKHGSRWIIDCLTKQDHTARKRANELLGDAKCAGVRIIRTWERPDGVSVDTEVFCQIREVKEDKTVRISPVETVKGNCHTLEQFSGFDSRHAMSRIFRDYLAKAFVTPTEIIHSLPQLKRINKIDGLVESAVEMVATLQTQESGQNFSSRRDEIYRAVDEMIERARANDTVKLPKLDRKFSVVMGSLGDALDRDQRSYRMLAALSRDLGKLPNWVSKLELLCTMADAETDPEAIEMLDGVIADVLGTDVIQDILGAQPGLGATICALLDLADGSVPGTNTRDGDVTATLCRLLTSGKLPASRRIIIERAHRALRLPSPLKTQDPGRESEELRKIIARIVTPTGLHSGGDTAHALITRFSRMVEEGGKAGRRAAISGVFHAMPDTAHGIMYLCDAGRSDFAKEHLVDMEALLKQVMTTNAINNFCRRSLKLYERLTHSTAAYHAISMSPFSTETKAGIADHIDALLERFVIDEKIIERLDQPEKHFHERALRLLQFCVSGLLPKGKALARVHDRVLSLLNEPDFPARFMAGIDDPKSAEQALHDFHVLLNKSGISSPLPGVTGVREDGERGVRRDSRVRE